VVSLSASPGRKIFSLTRTSGRQRIEGHTLAVSPALLASRSS
jgi:hypothetical protein